MASDPSGSNGIDTRRASAVTFAARLAFEDIHHSYHNKETIRGISLTAEPGEVLCLLGPSGSGKTTLLRIAAGIEAQTSGRVLLNDREIAGPDVFLPPERRGVGLLPFRQVLAGTERTTSTGQDHGPHGAVSRDRLERLAQRDLHRGRQRIERLRPVKGQRRDRACDLDAQAVGHVDAAIS